MTKAAGAVPLRVRVWRGELRSLVLALAAVCDNRAEARARACKRLVHRFLPSGTAAPNDPRTRQNGAGAGSKMVRFPFVA